MTDLDLNQKLDILRSRMNETRVIMQQMYDVEADVTEIKSVLEDLRKLEPGRRAFRKVGSALVEKTVKDLIPNLENDLSELDSVHSMLKTKGENLKREVDHYIVTNKLQDYIIQ